MKECFLYRFTITFLSMRKTFVPQHMCGGRETALRTSFSSSSLWLSTLGSRLLSPRSHLASLKECFFKTELMVLRVSPLPASCPDPTGLSSSCSRSGRGQHSHQPSPCSQYEPRGCCASLETRPAPFLTPAHTHASTPRAPPPHPSCASPAPTPSPLQE